MKTNEKIVFFTFVSDNYYYPVGTFKMVNSFKRFHPDIDLVVFRQDMVDKVFKENPGINFYNAKPVFAKLLTDKYDLVVNIDADSIILGRLEAVLSGDYEVGSVSNYNDYENRSIKNVTKKMFLNAGLVASRNPLFWDIWNDWNKNLDAMKYTCKENDILNLVWYNDSTIKKMKRKVFDKNKDYYGVKSLNREPEFVIDRNRVMCRGEQVFIYHHAKGGVLPKLQFETMGFPPEVVMFMNKISMEGVTEKYGNTKTLLDQSTTI